MNRALAVRLAILIAAIAALDAVARAKLLGPSLSVTPWTMVRQVGVSFASGQVYPHLERTALEVLLSFAIAVALGIPSGIALWRNPTLAEVVEPVLVGYYAVPLVVLYPIFIVLLGAGLWPIVAIGVLSAYGAIVVNTAVALRGIPRVYIAVGRTNRVSRWQMIRHIAIPASAPQLFVGLKLAVIYAVIGCIAAEFLLSTKGLGYEISYFYDNFETKQMFATIVLAVALSVGMNSALNAIEHRLGRHRKLTR